MLKILAIDDKLDNLVTLSALLTKLLPGCTVINAQSGKEGIAQAKTELPDAILLDIITPDLEGIETCRSLKAEDSTKHIPVIVITARRTDPDIRIKGLEIGADAFLTKPIDEYELVSQVKVVLRIKQAEDALRRQRDELEREVIARKQAEEERRTLLERLQCAEKMEVLGQMAGGVAHDINNVLGVLSGYSELLLEMLPVGSPLREYAANILKSSEKGAAIIQDLLTLARRGVAAPKVIDFNHIVADLLTTPEFDKLKASHPQMTIKTNMEKNPLPIKGSPIHLERTVLNLLSSAAETIVGKGELLIRTESRYLDKAVRNYETVVEGEYAVLTVSDTGKGISPEDMGKMFEPFYTKKKMGRSGTGLGLTIVWGTVKDHEGYVDVQSVEGEGTTITLYFPVTREKVIEEEQEVPIEQYLGHGESVLVVDDVPEQRQVATTLLMRLGYQVNAVSSGEDAVEYLKSNKADILVLDMIMAPGIDGMETYQKAREINPQQKAILVSGFSQTDRTREAQKLGTGAYVKKPYALQKIGLAIQAELRR